MMPDRPGVVVPPELCRALSRLASIGVRVLTGESGGLPVAPGLAAVLRQLDSVASATPAVTVEARQLTTAQAASVMGVSPQRVRELAADGKIIARKTGRDWLVDQRAAEQWRERRCQTR